MYINRSRKTSFRFSECDGDEDLPQFQGPRRVQYFAALAGLIDIFFRILFFKNVPFSSKISQNFICISEHGSSRVRNGSQLVGRG